MPDDDTLHVRTMKASTRNLSWLAFASGWLAYASGQKSQNALHVRRSVLNCVAGPARSFVRHWGTLVQCWGTLAQCWCALAPHSSAQLTVPQYDRVYAFGSSAPHQTLTARNPKH
eukprot:3754626-Pyramimonas_sp.AAC.1